MADFLTQIAVQQQDSEPSAKPVIPPLFSEGPSVAEDLPKSSVFDQVQAGSEGASKSKDMADRLVVQPENGRKEGVEESSKHTVRHRTETPIEKRNQAAQAQLQGSSMKQRSEQQVQPRVDPVAGPGQQLAYPKTREEQHDQSVASEHESTKPGLELEKPEKPDERSESAQTEVTSENDLPRNARARLDGPPVNAKQQQDQSPATIMPKVDRPAKDLDDRSEPAVKPEGQQLPAAQRLSVTREGRKTLMPQESVALPPVRTDVSRAGKSKQETSARIPERSTKTQTNNDSEASAAESSERKTIHIDMDERRREEPQNVRREEAEKKESRIAKRSEDRDDRPHFDGRKEEATDQRKESTRIAAAERIEKDAPTTRVHEPRERDGTAAVERRRKGPETLRQDTDSRRYGRKGREESGRTIQVRIGKVEVKATPEPDGEQTTSSPPTFTPALTLDAYLQRRNG